MTRRTRTAVIAALVTLAAAAGCTSEAPQAGTSVPSLTDQTYPGTIHAPTTESGMASVSVSDDETAATLTSERSSSEAPERTEITITRNTGADDTDSSEDSGVAESSRPGTSEVAVSSDSETAVDTASGHQATSSGSSPQSSPEPSRRVDTTTIQDPEAEAAARKEVEEAWLRYWDVYLDLDQMPKEDRLAAFKSVAVGAELDTLIDTAPRLDDAGLINTGSVKHRIYLVSPSVGAGDVTIADCVNESHLRTKNIKTGKLHPFGSDRVDYVGSLLKQADGSWKVSYLAQRKDHAC